MRVSGGKLRYCGSGRPHALEISRLRAGLMAFPKLESNYVEASDTT